MLIAYLVKSTQNLGGFAIFIPQTLSELRKDYFAMNE